MGNMRGFGFVGNGRTSDGEGTRSIHQRCGKLRLKLVAAMEVVPCDVLPVEELRLKPHVVLVEFGCAHTRFGKLRTYTFTEVNAAARRGLGDVQPGHSGEVLGEDGLALGTW